MTDAAPLWASFDAVGFDLDGVLYRGPLPVPGAPEAVRALQQAGIGIGYVTNNAARPPQAVVDQLAGFGISCTAGDIVTSAQATAHIMAADLPVGAQVLVVGSQALADEVAAVGLTPVWQRSASTAAIIVGFEPELTWSKLNEGCYAVEQGAVFYACNNDLTRPTDAGLAVGTGAILLAMAQPLGGKPPIMGGKPARPLLDEARGRLGAQHPLFVGDRLDTDIEGARVAGWASLFVLSGSHGPSDLVAAPPQRRPDFLAANVGGVLQPARVASFSNGLWRCGEATAVVNGDVAVITGPQETEAQRLDALWALANLAWQCADDGVSCDATNSLR